MIRLEHRIAIDRPLQVAYALARDVERYPEFLPGYIESKIVARAGERMLLQRSALVGGYIQEWKSWASFPDDRTLIFEHAEGPLKGMNVLWRFDARSQDQTELTITHQFPQRSIIGVRWFRDYFVYRPNIDRLASHVAAAFKTACESRALQAV
jgi:ribosome-associated toxin RatA of RatAB toxin-antitoxin module